MKTIRRSFFKNPVRDKAWFEQWVATLEMHNGRTYERIEVESALGKTHIWGLNTRDETLEPLVIFPGARTTALFWDFDRGLDQLGRNFRVFLVETNGLPNLSDGKTPDIASRDYGIWAAGLLDQLNLPSAFVAGASFGGLICMKLCIVAPKRVRAAFLLNPGCLQPFSMTFKNLYYNLLPILVPTRNNVIKFLDKAVFCKPHHALTAISERLVIEYELFALNRFRDNTQKPYHLHRELEQVTVDTYLLVGGKDLLFPPGTSIINAQNKIRTLKEVMLFEHVGHGIETYGKAIRTIGRKISNQ